MSGFSKKTSFKDLNEASEAYSKLVDRIEELEKYIKILYHKHNVNKRVTGASLHEATGNITNANRKISQLSKG